MRCISAGSRRPFCPSWMLILLVTLGPLSAPSPAAAIDLPGGTVTINLTSSVTNPSYTFRNTTSQPVCDLLLSTNDSDGIDPDFEGDIVVRRPPGGTNLFWSEIPTPGDGVEDIKTLAPSQPDCIGLFTEFSVGMVFDAVGSGDILRVTPTNVDGHQIMPAEVAGLELKTVHRFFNGYAGLPGSTSATFDSINGLPAAVSRLVVLSDTPGTTVADVTSSLPSTFDPASGLLEFSSPIPPQGAVDFTVFLDQLAPFVSGDPNPFTIVVAEAQVSAVAIPALEPGMLAVLAVVLAALGCLAVRRSRRA